MHVDLSVSGSIGRQNGELGGSVRRMWSLVPRKRGWIIRVLSAQGKIDMSVERSAFARARVCLVLSDPFHI